MIVAVLAIVARVGIPNVAESILTSRGTEIVRQVETLEEAVRAYVGETGRWPAETAPGEVPGELVPGFLDPSFTFARDAYTLDYDHWTLDGELAEATGRSDIGAVSVRIVDEGLQRGVMRAAAPRIWYRSDETFGFLLQGY